MDEGFKKKTTKNLCFCLSKISTDLDKYSTGRRCASFPGQL